MTELEGTILAELHLDDKEIEGTDLAEGTRNLAALALEDLVNIHASQGDAIITSDEWSRKLYDFALDVAYRGERGYTTMQATIAVIQHLIRIFMIAYKMLHEENFCENPLPHIRAFYKENYRFLQNTYPLLTIEHYQVPHEALSN